MYPMYSLVFDKVMIKQLQKAAKNNQLKAIIKSMLDELELKGPTAGKLLDSHLFIYEIKTNIHLSVFTLSTIFKLMKFMFLNLK